MNQQHRNFVQLVQTAVIMSCHSPLARARGISLLSAVQNMREECVPEFEGCETLGVPEASSAAYKLVEWALEGFDQDKKPEWFQFQDED